MATAEHSIHPGKPIRRFDFFAEHTRLERLDKGYAQDEAKGYGIWLAKLVAARRVGSTCDGSTSSEEDAGPQAEVPIAWGRAAD